MLKDRLQNENIYLQEEIKNDHNFENIIGQSDALKQVLSKIEKVAPTDTTVIILGETGSGKELVARAVHNMSRRCERPLVKVNCAALPSNLIESELFGHEKGAFTSATSKMVGRFELANHSTIFLDEIGELPMELQPKLLRVLEDGEFERLGSARTLNVKTRVIAATNRNLEDEVNKGQFRQDLWYRLNIFPIQIPPLRERKEDIPLLVQAFLKKHNKKLGKTVEKIPHSTMTALQNYSWPGNVRELENIVERSVINTQGNVLRLVENLIPSSKGKPLISNLTKLEDVERDHIISVLEKTHWQVAGDYGAAAILGLNPSTLRGRMRKLGITKPMPRL